MYNNYNQGYYPTNGVYSNNEFYPEAGSEDERFFLAPLVVGGLAGTALGYGIANNNQINNQGMPCCSQPIMFVPTPMYPQQYQQPPMFSSTNSNNYYY